ncbi:site-specific tyrosine recombinase/integron integrase [Sulfurisphaera tokodaii]|uniref:Tyrosine recombinase XerA n=2 Tax=Sulfurisphaera tokodaii TaxID=111955 RepID=Q971G0_SULTO|nr:site-specific tyrosine recombinase/integron integrase [Sulfurisphaera tokodaii]BAB66460.1 tyrosine recombinase XerA [Sulfurisphaera tokodaii str. 7]HII73724.1 tyrosine-type recombinase/integrase [Sulfurisphaera tokodaii]
MKLQLGKPDVIINPFDEFITALMIAGASENTIRLYSIAISDFLSYIRKDPRTVTTYDLNNWIRNILSRETKSKNENEIEKRRKKSVTARHYIIAVLRFLKWLGVDVKPTIPRIRRKEIRALSEEEIVKIKENVKKLKDRLLIQLLLDTGLRSKELLSIKKSDINIERRYIIVRNTKNGEERIVFFTEETARLLKSYLRNIEDNGILFNMTYHALYRKLKRLGKKLGIDLRPHILRHTFATQAIRKGMPLPVVQKLLGHKDIRTTQIYTHLVTEDLQEIYKKIFG